jgi:hypothetical protein
MSYLSLKNTSTLGWSPCAAICITFKPELFFKFIVNVGNLKKDEAEKKLSGLISDYKKDIDIKLD